MIKIEAIRRFLMARTLLLLNACERGLPPLLAILGELMLMFPWLENHPYLRSRVGFLMAELLRQHGWRPDRSVRLAWRPVRVCRALHEVKDAYVERETKRCHASWRTGKRAPDQKHENLGECLDRVGRAALIVESAGIEDASRCIREKSFNQCTEFKPPLVP